MDINTGEDDLMLTFSWCHDTHFKQEILDLFISNLSTNYISHSELQEGRAIDKTHWHPQLADKIAEDITRSIDPKHPSFLLAVGIENNQLLAAAFITLSTTNIPYATLEDMVVSPLTRGKGIGQQFFTWIEQECRTKGIQRLFLESGIQNQGAHHFFEKAGFAPVSVTMMKELDKQ